jgi:integrase
MVVHMALAMARPWKHPKTGVYWFRKRVPASLQPSVGKSEEKFSLRTKDPAEAKRLHAAAIVKVDQRWATLREPPKTLTEMEAHELARPLFDWFVALHQDNPSEQTMWRMDLYERLWVRRDFLSIDFDVTKIDNDSPAIFSMEKLSTDGASWIATERGLPIDSLSHRRLERAVSHTLQRASQAIETMAKGGHLLYEPENATRKSEESHSTNPISFDELLNGWSDEKRPAEKTVYMWSNVCHAFTEFIGHSDASKVSPGDLIRWKESLVAAGYETSTIRDGKIGPLKAIMQWGVNNRKLNKNPAAKIVVGQRSGAGIRGFSDDEAAIIIQAALLSTDPVKHWLPILGCWTGERLSELAQLRKQDIVDINGIPCIQFVHEAGSLKNLGSERIVPIHPAMIDSGFINYVSKMQDGPIFKSVVPDRFGNRGGNATKVISRWVRSLGIVDKRISPSHSWRHRFKTLCRRYGVSLDISDALTGHGKKNVSAQYGEYPVEAIYRELVKIPKLGV